MSLYVLFKFKGSIDSCLYDNFKSKTVEEQSEHPFFEPEDSKEVEKEGRPWSSALQLWSSWSVGFPNKTLTHMLGCLSLTENESHQQLSWGSILCMEIELPSHCNQ